MLIGELIKIRDSAEKNQLRNRDLGVEYAKKLPLMNLQEQFDDHNSLTASAMTRLDRRRN